MNWSRDLDRLVGLTLIAGFSKPTKDGEERKIYRASLHELFAPRFQAVQLSAMLVECKIGGAQQMAEIKIGDVVFQILDSPEIRPLAADIFTECRFNGAFGCLAFAAITVDGDGKPVARIVSRVRISLATIADLRNAFDGILKESMPGKEKAN